MCGSGKFRCEAEAYLFVESLSWDGSPRCPHCGERSRLGRLRGRSTSPGTWKCYRCRKPFSVRIGTAFHNSHVPLHVWLQALYLMAASGGRVSVHSLSQVLMVSQRTAWHLKQRIAASFEALAPDGTGKAAAPAGDVDLALTPQPGEPGEPWLNVSRYERFRQAAEAKGGPETRPLFLAGLHGLLGHKLQAAPRDEGRDEVQLELLLEARPERDRSLPPHAGALLSSGLRTAGPSHADPTTPEDGRHVRAQPPHPFPSRHLNPRNIGSRLHPF